MLDEIKTYEKYDVHEVSFGVEHLPEQVHAAWQTTRGISVPKGFSSAEQVVIVGMGGSGLAGELLGSALAAEAKLPIITVHDYVLPAFVSKKTIVALVSFSGDTEEVLSAANDALKKKAKVLVITTGGKLAEMAEANKWPMYQFAPGDLAKRPNLGIGFLFAGLIGLLERAGVIKLSNARIARMLEAMSEVAETCALNVETAENPAKTVANELKGKSILFIASEHLAGCALTMEHQVNETAKQFASSMTLPELNHHFLESLSNPVGFFSKFGALMIRSSQYGKRTQIRYNVTADLFEHLGATVIDYETRGSDTLEEAAEVLQFGTFLSYYLGILNKVDLVRIPHIDAVKRRMAKEK